MKPYIAPDAATSVEGVCECFDKCLVDIDKAFDAFEQLTCSIDMLLEQGGLRAGRSEDIAVNILEEMALRDRSQLAEKLYHDFYELQNDLRKIMKNTELANPTIGSSSDSDFPTIPNYLGELLFYPEGGPDCHGDCDGD